MANESKNLPIVKAEDLKNADHDDYAWDYLFNFTDKYFEMISNDPQVLRDFNDSQLVLLAYNYLYGELVNGGFIQLINNRNAYAFESPFPEIMQSWGAVKTVEIVDKAKVIFEKHKEELLRDKTEAEFSELYKKITDFEPLEEEFYQCMDEETKIIKKYVKEHVNDFATVV